MTNNNNPKAIELSYFRLSLLSYLKDTHPDKADDHAFIRLRADLAAETYSACIKQGMTHFEAGEAAAIELFRGLHFSIYNTLVDILWEEFSGEIPEEEARSTALRLLPLCAHITGKYTLSDDFAHTPEYDLFYAELTETVQILIEYGLI